MSPRVDPPRRPRLRVAAVEVAEYLRRHPNFFAKHLDLLEILEVPHPCGSAVSLVARQIDQLREKTRRLESQLNDIVQIARDNDILHQRIHQLTLALLAACSLEDALACLEWGLTEYFQTDFVAVRITDPSVVTPIANLRWVPAGGAQESMAEVLEAGHPVCGQPNPEEARLLFGAAAGEVASQALIPLRHAGLRGVLAIGSRDPQRFRPGMGAVFLSQLGEIIAARLAVLVGGDD